MCVCGRGQVTWSTLGVFREISGEDVTRNADDVYQISRLFEAAARRDVADLAGLQRYLYLNGKKLSDTLCECDQQQQQRLNGRSPW